MSAAGSDPCPGAKPNKARCVLYCSDFGQADKQKNIQPQLLFVAFFQTEMDVSTDTHSTFALRFQTEKQRITKKSYTDSVEVVILQLVLDIARNAKLPFGLY